MPKTATKKKPAKPPASAMKYARRSDLGADIGETLAKVKGPAGVTMRRLHAMISAADNTMSGAIKWGNPTYTRRGMLFALCQTSKGVNVMIMNGTQLKDPAGLLEGTGKSCRHVKVAIPGPIPEREIRSLLKQAIALEGKPG